MTSGEAEEIVKEFGNILENKKTIFIGARDLPHSPGMIKYAFFVYAEALVRDGALQEDMFNAMQMSYAAIDINCVENAEESNTIYFKLKADDIVKAIDMINPLAKTVEFHNFVVDCEGRW